MEAPSLPPHYIKVFILWIRPADHGGAHPKGEIITEIQ
jgi:hypothetical protein